MTPCSTEFLDRRLVRVLIVAMVPFLFVASLRICAVRTGEIDADSFYHVAMAEMGPSYYMSKTFPHMTLSVWQDCFADKELGFHLALGAIRKMDSLLSLPTDEPFHAEALAFALLMFLAFSLLLNDFGVKFGIVFSVLTVLVSPFFLFRTLMLRPHVPGLAIMFLSCLFLGRARRIRDLAPVAIAGFAYSWFYSNPHFIMLPAMAFAVAKFKKERRTAVLLPVAALAGVVLGYLIHPQFPNTFIVWKIQCIDVPIQILRGSMPVSMGEELSRPGRDFLIANSAIFTLLALNAATMAAGIRSKIRFDKRTYAIAIVAAISAAGMLLSKRAAEYAAPFTVLMAGLVFTDVFPLLKTRMGGAYRKFAMCLVPSILILLAALAWKKQSASLKNVRFNVCRDFAEWAANKAEIPMGTVIANPNWSDFPMLMYAAPQYRYLMGIEPMFGYFSHPAKVARLERFRTGRIKLSPRELRETVGSNLAFVSAFNWRLARDMFNDGFAIVYQGPDGWLFDLGRSVENTGK